MKIECSGQIYQYTKRKKRGFKRRMDRLIRKFTMHNRMITEAYYRERSPELGFFRRGLTLGLLCLASVTGKAYSHRGHRCRTQGLYQPDFRLPAGIPASHPAHELHGPGQADSSVRRHRPLTCSIPCSLRPFDDPKTVFYLVGGEAPLPFLYPLSCAGRKNRPGRRPWKRPATTR